MVRVTLSRDELLGAHRRPVQRVSTPELVGDILIRALNPRESTDLWNAMKATEDYGELCVMQIAAFVSDENGSPVFKTLEEAGAFVDSLSVVVAVRIIKAGSELNDLSQKGVEQAEKN